MFTVRITDSYGGSIETYPVRQKEFAQAFAVYFGKTVKKRTKKGKCSGTVEIEVIEHGETQNSLRNRSQYL